VFRVLARRRRLVLVLGASLTVVVGCSPGLPHQPASRPPAAEVVPTAKLAATDESTVPELQPISWLHDDYEGALTQAREQGKLLLVDVWAPWCHTCLAMKQGVLRDPALRRFTEHVVFLALDSDRPESAGFLGEHAVRAWPSFFVLRPSAVTADDAAPPSRVLGLIAGAASTDEMVALLDDSLSLSTHPGESLLAIASAATASRNHAGAAQAYQRYVEGGATSRRSDALLGWLRALHAGGQFHACVDLGIARADDVTGAAAPADFTYYLRACAKQLSSLEKDEPKVDQARQIAVRRLRSLTEAPPKGASPDDRADALAQLADALRELSDPNGARRADEARLSLMNEAAAAASDAAGRAIYDYQRAGAYLALGRGNEAVLMLREREREMPEAYEPPARLAWVLTTVGRHEEARGAIERALSRSYGPRRMRYLAMKADILGTLGDERGQLEVLREVVDGHEALPAGQRNEGKLERARRRLAAQEQRVVR